jgi:hypothetical protein
METLVSILSFTWTLSAKRVFRPRDAFTRPRKSPVFHLCIPFRLLVVIFSTRVTRLRLVPRARKLKCGWVVIKNKM